MAAARKTVALLVLAAVAGGGYLFVTQIPTLVREYQQAREFSSTWGYIYLSVMSLTALAVLLLIGWGLWLLSRTSADKQLRQRAQSRNPSQMTVAEQSVETDLHLADVDRLADDASLPADIRAPLRRSVADIQHKREGQKLEIVAFGTVSSGKSSLLNLLAGREIFRTDPKGGTTTTRSEIPWPGTDKVVLVDTPGLAEIHGDQRESLARLAARDADLVLFIVDGPLKDFEHRVLCELAQMEKRVVVCLNKEDWFAPGDRRRLVEQLLEQAGSLVHVDDVITLRARPTLRTRVRVLPDGRELEESVNEEPDIRPLAERIMAIVERDGRELLAANLLLQARGLAVDAKQQIQTTLDLRAEEIVERAMWQAGAAGALSPLPLLDIAAGLAISTNMVLALARVYRQSIDLETASRLIGELGKNLVAIVGSSAAAPAVGAAVAAMLKTAPGVGTLAGGALQGIVQALVTRWIGRVFMVYFRGEMQQPASGWAALARAKWNEVTRPAELVQLVKTGVARLGGKRS